MSEEYINLTAENFAEEHLCCAIADKKHQCGVEAKKMWLQKRIPEGHVFRKLDEKGKVFIEYAPLETAWTPVLGDNYIYIYCLWVSGRFKGRGHGKALLSYCIKDAEAQGKSGVCVLSAKKKKPFLSDKKFMEKYGFEAVDETGGYELLALSFDGKKPAFCESARRPAAGGRGLVVYYTAQCPYSLNCIEQMESYCMDNGVPLKTVCVDSLEKAKSVPCVFNNWAVFYDGKFETIHLLNEGYLKKLLRASS
jgi:ribosomal protein S18 acetylase RimI-like enzyme